tara:strand:- start:1373 stop:2545 length:1173 start_codon:yes stop_codon:yes gene_type:complete
MIRIDEIYENTFLPWVRKNLSNTAIFYCDPFGRSDPDSIVYRGLPDGREKNNIFFFDQEPVQLSIHLPTFHSFNLRNSYTTNDNEKKFLVTSETNSDNIDYICKLYSLQPFYYFFHGWAALDWYRGYDRTFCIIPPEQRRIKKTFFSANRIIGGERSHRVIQLYFFQLFDLMHNHISAPKVCPVENKDIIDIAKFYRHKYPDEFVINFFKTQQEFKGGILETISQIELPRLFPGEDTQRMSSCWLDQFELCAESMIYHVSETVFFGRRQHLTEKTFKPIAMGMPFILSAPAGSLAYLKQYGFKTFDSVWSEWYDTVESDIRRIESVSHLLKKLDDQSESEKNEMFKKCIPIIEHNWNHFYGGGFEKILWAELTTMLHHLKAATQGDLSSN